MAKLIVYEGRVGQVGNNLVLPMPLKVRTRMSSTMKFPAVVPWGERLVVRFYGTYQAAGGRSARWVYIPADRVVACRLSVGDAVRYVLDTDTPHQLTVDHG